MGRGIVNVLLGGIMIIGGLSGKLVLKGTGSGGALAVIGLLVAGIGVYRIAKASEAT